jgi:hypothetical protein
MADEFDAWLSGIGINVEAVLRAAGAATAPAQPAKLPDDEQRMYDLFGEGALKAYQGKKKHDAQIASLPQDEQVMEKAFGDEVLKEYQQQKKHSAEIAKLPGDEQAMDHAFGDEALKNYQQAKQQALSRAQELAQAHDTFLKTGKVPATKIPFLPIEVKLGKSMSRAERYDAMVESMQKQQCSAARTCVSEEDSDGIDDRDKHQVLVDDITNDNRDPDYLTKEEFHDEFWSREKAEYNACGEDNIRPGTIDECQSAVDEKYGGENFKEWRAQHEQEAAAAYRQYQDKVEGIANSGPTSLLGRVVGRAIGGEKGEEIGATIGGWLDTGTAIYAGTRGGSVEEKAGGPAPEDESIPHTAPPPENDPAGTRPDPVPATDVDVVKANVNAPSSIKTQPPEAHQADWEARGGAGKAPPAYRDGEGNVRVSSDHPLMQNKGGISPIRPGADAPPAPAGSSPKTAGQPPLANPKSDAGTAATKPAPAPPAKPPVDPQANTPPAQEANVSPKAGTGAAAAESQRSQAPEPRAAQQRPPPAPPQPVSAETVERIRNQPPPSGGPKGRGSNAGYTVDHDAHELAWQRLGGHGPSPPAFIYDNQVYLDKSRWPSK